MTIRALIAEDEPVLAATLSRTLLQLWPELSIVASCANGVQALEQARELRPDVLFLDIKMPGMTGLEVAQELAEDADSRPGARLPRIVFVTAYDDYAATAFEQAAVDYVLKPVSAARLAKTVDRLRQGFDTAPDLGQLSQLLAQIRQAVPSPQVERLQVIRAGVGNQVRMIPTAEVILFETLDKYVNVVTADGEALIRMSLKELLPQLDSNQFWQVHRSTVVNVACIESAVRDDFGRISLRLRGQARTPRVSTMYAHLFRQM